MQDHGIPWTVWKGAIFYIPTTHSGHPCLSASASPVQICPPATIGFSQSWKFPLKEKKFQAINNVKEYDKVTNVTQKEYFEDHFENWKGSWDMGVKFQCVIAWSRLFFPNSKWLDPFRTDLISYSGLHLDESSKETKKWKQTCWEMRSWNLFPRYLSILFWTSLALFG